MNYPLGQAILGFAAQGHLDERRRPRATTSTAAPCTGATARPSGRARAPDGPLRPRDHRGPAQPARQPRQPALPDDGGRRPRAYHLAVLLQATLPGAPCTYYGDEIGVEPAATTRMPPRRSPGTSALGSRRARRGRARACGAGTRPCARRVPRAAPRLVRASSGRTTAVAFVVALNAGERTGAFVRRSRTRPVEVPVLAAAAGRRAPGDPVSSPTRAPRRAAGPRRRRLVAVARRPRRGVAPRSAGSSSAATANQRIGGVCSPNVCRPPVRARRPRWSERLGRGHRRRGQDPPCARRARAARSRARGRRSWTPRAPAALARLLGRRRAPGSRAAARRSGSTGARRRPRRDRQPVVRVPGRRRRRPRRGRPRAAPRTAACSSSTTTGATTSARSRDPRAPEYRVWSRREGPFLRDGGFKIRVVHCFWTFASSRTPQAFLADAFGERGEAVAAAPPRPRLIWNVAVYHRWRGGVEPERP